MPRYYIDTDDGVTHVHDMDGGEFTSVVDARNLAHRALADMASQNLPDGEQHAFTAVVRDETGLEWYSATMTLQGMWKIRPAS